ncbi:UNVERIFIED_CONTAM: hypothetical protein FKN15_035801 [Acipenser sinensis]
MQNTRLMSGKSLFHPCTACNANILQEDKHTLCALCLGIQHATLALERDVACSICAAFQPRVKENRLERVTKASSVSSVAGLSAALGAPEPLLHDLSQYQSSRSHFPSLQVRTVKQAGPVRGGVSSPSDPQVAQENLVFDPVPAVTWPALGDPTAHGSPQSVERHSLAPGTGQILAMFLGPERDHWLALGLSDAVVDTLQSARADSSRPLYTYTHRKKIKLLLLFLASCKNTTLVSEAGFEIEPPSAKQEWLGDREMSDALERLIQGKEDFVIELAWMEEQARTTTSLGQR